MKTVVVLTSIFSGMLFCEFFRAAKSGAFAVAFGAGLLGVVAAWVAWMALGAMIDQARSIRRDVPTDPFRAFDDRDDGGIS